MTDWVDKLNEGELNAVMTKHPYATDGKEETITCYKGGTPFLFPQMNTYEGTNPDLVFMEYIGVKAVPNEKIFEGDVVSFQDVDTLKEEIVVITDIRELPDFKFTTNRRILGNIYENPELAEDEQ